MLSMKVGSNKMMMIFKSILNSKQKDKKVYRAKELKKNSSPV